MNRSVRGIAVVVAAAGVAALALAVTWTRQWGIGAVAILLALGWSAVVGLVDAYASRSCPVAGRPVPRGSAPVTFVVRWGEEPVEIARTGIALAAQAGPVVVLATREHELLGDLAGTAGIRCSVAPTMAEAMAAAVDRVDTDAVQIISAAAFPRADESRRAAAQLVDGIGWVTGRAVRVHAEHSVPSEREEMRAGARAAFRALGLVTWEPDATIVRTELLRDCAPEPNRPDGRWLRARAAAGWAGAGTDETVAVRLVPTDAPVFWATEARREQGATADLADAVTRGRARTRLLASGALLRELYAYSLALWLLVLVVIGRTGRFPFAVGPVPFFAGCGAIAGARWMTSRSLYRVGLHPLREARLVVYGIPASLVALPSALSGRLRVTRWTMPSQPLLWVAAALTILTTVPLFDHRTSDRGSIGVGVGLATAMLAATWVFAVRATGALRDDRAGARVRVEAPAMIGGVPARTVDASSSGLSVVVPFADRGPGDPVVVSVDFDDGRVADVRARIVAARRSAHGTVLGLALDLTAVQRGPWLRSVFAAAGWTGPTDVGAPAGHRHHPPAVRHRGQISAGRQIVLGVEYALVGLVTVLVGSALLIMLMGYRPLVVRSGSMSPTLQVGDVVVSDWVRADHVRPGEVVSFVPPDDPGDVVTHRVRRVVARGSELTVETQGDANELPERWTAAPATLVGRVAFTIPRVGTILILLGRAGARQLLVVGSAVVLLVGAVTGSRRRARRGPVPQGPQGQPLTTGP